MRPERRLFVRPAFVVAALILLFFTAPSRGQMFVEVPTIFPALSFCTVAWGDFDNDGYWDCIMIGSTNNSPLSGGVTKVFRNLGNGSFQEITTGIIGVANGDVAWGDFDNDGDLDILIAGYSATGAVCRVYRNDGNGI